MLRFARNAGLGVAVTGLIAELSLYDGNLLLPEISYISIFLIDNFSICLNLKY